MTPRWWMAVVAGALLGGACGPEPETESPRACNPRDPHVPRHTTCCSDDPVRLGGDPLFSSLNNQLSSSGLLVDDGDVPPEAADPSLPACPIACDPRWDADTVATVCGAGRACCQTRELTQNDCVMDGASFRPARGQDYLDGLSTWEPMEHDTHQDPGLSVCRQLGVEQDPLDPEGTPVFVDCVRLLGVADSRGWCVTLAEGQVCPTASPAYLDACEKLNMGLPP